MHQGQLLAGACCRTLSETRTSSELTPAQPLPEGVLMAWRIDDALVRGELDNSGEGKVTGRIWLLGRNEPLELELDGDCWRDLAGGKLSFINPAPRPQPELAVLGTEQRGVVGDITASHKIRVATSGIEEIEALQASGEPVPYAWRPSFYFEWFSQQNGRVLIEATDLQISASEAAWTMDADAEQAQQLLNLQAMRDYITGAIRRRKSHDSEADDEFAWEQRLRESDRMAEAYQEVLEKYMDDPDCERKEAFVMGWDGLLNAMAERDESGIDDDLESTPRFEIEDGDDLPDDPEFDPPHPLQERAYQLALLSHRLVERDAPMDSPSHRLVSNLLQVSAKLAGALHSTDADGEYENGFVLAILKRCVNWMNDALAASSELLVLEAEPARKKELVALRNEIFAVRDSLVELRREFKQN